PTEPPSPEPAPTPEVGETSAPPVGVPEPDLDPPTLPMPTTWDEVDGWMLNNPIYAESTVVPTNCTLGRIDVTTATPEAMQEHLNTLTGCLMMVWQEPMQRAGFIMPRPPITVYTAPITTACGQSSNQNASYCAGDQRMYYSYDIHEAFRRYNPEVIDNAFLPDLVMGHEFGHAMQARSGILLAELYAEQYRAENESQELELSRRIEVQADCFAGIFLNSVAQASRMTEEDRAGILEMAKALGDDSLSGRPDIESGHGWGVNRQHWARTGLAANQVNVCNTFTADPTLVR
ncbi:MAG: neutral zinc metallopeptidase, partial [Propionibacteriaceae bacterium]|nr:neutral zinc metallopeptidase [Propionibacteriaceae bacterium]